MSPDQPDPTRIADGTQAVVGSIRRLLSIADEALDTANELARLFDPVSAARIETVLFDVRYIREAWRTV